MTGPRRRIIRRLGDLPGLTTRTAEGREYPPGEHGFAQANRRRRVSEYAVRLREKQKLRHYFGLSERQLRRQVLRAATGHGVTGEQLLTHLESRLDNLVFRLGLAATIPAARQLVTHGHIAVDGQRASFPGLEIQPGQRVTVHPSSRDMLTVAEAVKEGPRLQPPRYLQRDADGLGGVLLTVPGRDDVGLEIRENLVVEFYAR